MTPPVVAAGLLLALLVLAELSAVPLATRAVDDALGRCVVHRAVTIEQVRRPVLPRLLVGRAQDGLAREIALPPQVRVGAVAGGDREVTAPLHVDELPGVDGDGCTEPVTSDEPGPPVPS